MYQVVPALMIINLSPRYICGTHSKLSCRWLAIVLLKAPRALVRPTLREKAEMLQSHTCSVIGNKEDFRRLEGSTHFEDTSCTQQHLLPIVPS